MPDRKLIELLDIEPEKFRLKDDPTKIVHGSIVGTANYCVDEKKFNNEDRDKCLFKEIPASANAYLIGTIGIGPSGKGQRIFFYKIDDAA